MARHFAPYEEKLQSQSRGGEPCIEILTKILRAIASDDFDAAGPYLAEDMDMDIHGPSHMSGSWSGREAVLAALRRNFNSVTEQRPKILEMVEAGGKIAVRIEEGGRFRESKALYSFRGIQWFRFEDGLLKYFEQYLQPLPVLPEDMP
jgi:ketosteroid isomerase-like protein